jgi:hypothetical protein
METVSVMFKCGECVQLGRGLRKFCQLLLFIGVNHFENMAFGFSVCRFLS